MKDFKEEDLKAMHAEEEFERSIDKSLEHPEPVEVEDMPINIGKSSAVKAYGKECAARLGLKYSEDPADINKEDTFLVNVIPTFCISMSELRGIPIPSEDRKNARKTES